ncbi:MAG: hypothetical protein ACYC6L_07720 [Anaerolineae bacterium]
MTTSSSTDPVKNPTPDSDNTGIPQAIYGGLPPTPPRGFIGRTEEREALEQTLGRSGSAVVSVTGAEGSGKTTLIAQAARTLAANHRFSKVVYSSFAGGGDIDTALWDLVTFLPGKVDLNSDVVAPLKRFLAKTPTLIIWDHLEALLPEGDAPSVESALPNLLLGGAELIAGSESKLVVVSDTGLPGLKVLPMQLAMPELQQLEEQDAKALLDSISPPMLADEDRIKVIKLSRGQPIAIQVFAALLHHFTPADLYTMVERVMPNALTTGIWSSQQAHDLALGTVWQALTPASREVFYGLGTFVAGGMERLVGQIENQDSESWRKFLSLTTQAGLVYTEQIPPLAIPYLHIHPALLHYTHRHAAREAQQRLSAWYCASYLALIKWIRDQEQRLHRDLAQLLWVEMPNFRRVFSLLLASQQLTYVQEYHQVLTFAMEKFGLQQEIELHNEMVRTLMQAALPKEGALSRAGVSFVIDQVQKLLESGKAQQALSVLQPMCQRIDKDDQLAYKGDDATFDRARANQLLGKVFLANNKPPMGLASMLRALTFYDKMTNQAPVRTELLTLLLDLTDLLLTAREIDQAQKMADRALLVAADLDEKSSLGKLNYRLALIAQHHNEMESSEQYANQALTYYEAVENPEGQAEARRHLATMEMQREQPEKAAEQLQQALQLAREASSPLLAADILVRLGSVNVQQDNLSEAEKCYLQALVIYQDHHFKPAQTSTEVLLSELLLKEGQVANARIHAEVARTLVDGAGPAAQPWAIYDLLERISLAEGDEEHALVWRRRTRESFVNTPQAQPILMRWRPILRKLAAACRGEALDEETLATLDKMEAEINNPDLFSTIWRILGGEWGSTLYESMGLGEAVVIKHLLDGIDNPKLLEEPTVETPGNKQSAPAGFSVDQFIGAVAAALQGDAQAKIATDSFIRMLESDQAPQSLRLFAAAIKRIMAGERDPSIAMGLPDELAQVISVLIMSLKEQDTPVS